MYCLLAHRNLGAEAKEEAVMTVILMFAMFAIFLTIDYVRKGKEAREAAEAKQEGASVSPHLMPTIVAGFDLPENCRYHQGHTGALQESPTLVRVGIDDFGARLVGKEWKWRHPE
jgi:hypothetical protein